MIVAKRNEDCNVTKVCSHSLCPDEFIHVCNILYSLMS